ncbi:energy transducer TonB [Desulfovibrio sp.]
MLHVDRVDGVAHGELSRELLLPGLRLFEAARGRGGGIGLAAALLALLLHGLVLAGALAFVPDAVEYADFPAYEVDLVSLVQGGGSGHEDGVPAVAARVASALPKQREPVPVRQDPRPAKSVPPRAAEPAPAPAPVAVPDPGAPASTDAVEDVPAPSAPPAAAPAGGEAPGPVAAQTHPAGLPHGQGQGLGPGLDGYGLGQVERAPRLLRKVEPKYPLAARRRQVTGKVLVKFLVDPEGRVRHLDVVESRPRGVFDQAAVEAVSAWEFSPGVLRGRNVSVWMLLPISFTLQ